MCRSQAMYNERLAVAVQRVIKVLNSVDMGNI